jgi:hypothetical protein
MNILHIVKEEPDTTTGAIILEHATIDHVTVIDLRENRDYEYIIRLLESHDRVMCW